MTPRRRVPAMAPEDRRAALIDATVPLLLEHGLEVSTKQIAQAAGVAEGTIFGVFKDKNSLVAAAVMHALDPQPLLDALAVIDPSAGLRERLATIADLVNERYRRAAPLMAASRKLFGLKEPDSDMVKRMIDSRRELLDAVTRLIEPDATHLRRSPDEVAQLFLLFCGANSFGPFASPEAYTGVEMASLLLDGVLIVPTGDEPVTIPLLARRKPEVP